jgi:hypothetical protein
VEVAVSYKISCKTNEGRLTFCSEEEDPDEYPFPLTLRSKRSNAPASPLDGVTVNGNGKETGGEVASS